MKKGDDLLKEILQRCASYKEEKNIPNIHARFFKDRQNAFEIVKKEILKHLSKLKETDKDKLVASRVKKFCAMGAVGE